MPVANTPLDRKDCYLGHALLKRAGVKTAYTSDALKELSRCSKDILYFTQTYCRIISLDDGEVPFKLHAYQKKMMVNMLSERFSLYMLPRQMGKSQVSAAFILHQVIFNTHYTVAILANKDSAAREILDRIQFMYELLPSWMQPGVVTWNKGDIELGNHSKIFTAATSPSSIRGRAVNLLYCVPGETRVTFSDDGDHVYHARIDSLPPPGTIDYIHKPPDRCEHRAVYKITNTVSGKFYFAAHSTDDLDDGYMGSGKLVMAAIEKHGVAAFKKEYLSIFVD